MIDIIYPEQGGPGGKKKKVDPVEKLVLIITALAIVFNTMHFLIKSPSRRVSNNVNYSPPEEAAMHSLLANNNTEIAQTCASTLVGLEFIFEAWRDEDDSTSTNINNFLARQVAKKMFYTNLEACTLLSYCNPHSEELFSLLKKAFIALLSIKGLANDGEISCEILPALAKKLVEHPLCAAGTISLTKGGESVEAPCVKMAYMTAFNKIRQHNEHKACTRNLDSIKSLVSSMNEYQRSEL